MSSWGSSAGRDTWLRAAAERGRMMAPATERMFALAGVVEGARVLDVGTGTGDVALLAAVRVGPTGSVVAIDSSPPMIEAAVAAARSAQLPQVVARVADAQALDLLPASFDAALGRNVLMFVNDLAQTLSGIRRVLRQNGRFAACTWAELDHNPFNAIVVDVVRRRRPVLDPSLELMRAFSLSSPRELSDAFERAGFAEVSVERVATVRSFSGLDGAMTPIREIPMYTELFNSLADDEKRAMLLEIETRYAAFLDADGGVRFPAESLVVVGTKH